MAYPTARMMLLFVSVENPLWKTLLSGDTTETKIAAYIGIARTTITNWKKNEAIGQVRAIYEKTRARIENASIIERPRSGRAHPEEKGLVKLSKEQKEEALAIVDQFFQMYSSQSPYHIYDVAKLLHISVEDCQRIIDEGIYSQRPLFPQIYYLKKEDCDKLFQFYRGIYYLWVKRYVAETHLWFRCPMQVRYILKIRGGYVIRCKLNFPMATPLGKLRYWEYDGFLAPRDASLFWMFERRPQLVFSSDYFYFITELGGNRPSYAQDTDSLTMSGLYLTTGQDVKRSIATGNVIMQRLRINSTDHEVSTNIMRDEVKVLDPDEDSANLNFLEEFRSPQ